MSPILTAAAPADPPYPLGLNSKSIASPKLSPIKAKSFVTPDGMTTPNVHPSSGKSTSTPGTLCLSVCVCMCMCVVYMCKYHVHVCVM